jgi:hypothetical protein
MAATRHNQGQAVRCILAVLVMAGALLAGCSSSKDIALAEAQIPRFRHLMAAQKFDEIYDAAGNELKKATTRKEMVALLSAVDRKLGPVKGSEKVRWNVNVHTSGMFVTLDYQTHFERGDGYETFVYQMVEDKALLVGYHINSNALIINQDTVTSVSRYRRHSHGAQAARVITRLRRIQAFIRDFQSVSRSAINSARLRSSDPSRILRSSGLART